MSRRRTPKDPSALPGLVKVRVVCTDQGQHPEVSFGAVKAWPSAAGGWRAKVDLNTRDQEFVDLAQTVPGQHPTPDRVHRTHRIRCRRCGRDVPLRQETVEGIGRDFGAAGKNTFDISLLSEHGLD